MKKLPLLFLAAAFLAAVSLPAYAGSGGKCTNDAQACLNHWAAKKDAAWLGLKYDKTESGDVVVMKIYDGSPAAAAGFKVGDQLLAMNGAKMDDKEAMKKAKGEWKAGNQVTYTVKRGNAEKQIAVTLAPMPEEVFASMLGQHMLSEHATTATAQAGGE